MLHCEDCEFDWDERRAHTAGFGIVKQAEALADLIATIDHPAERPAPDVWAPLEYACHVRDVLLTQRERVHLALIEDCPIPSRMGADARALNDRYAEQSVDDVARQLVDAATMFTNVLSHLSEEQWDRRMVYGYPEVAERTLRWVAVHTEHEVLHHLADARR